MPAEGAYYYINDHLGTPQIITDDNGAIVWKAHYTPFGTVTVDPGSTITNNLRFPGQYFDAETGLSYNWHRYYDPENGRYISADPIGLRGGLNLYAYTGNDPVNGVDPMGLLDFRYYGNWGGPGWTGGRWTSWDQMSPEQQRQAMDPNYRFAPVDEQDRTIGDRPRLNLNENS